jgi:carbonic anhydrase
LNKIALLFYGEGMALKTACLCAILFCMASSLEPSEVLDRLRKGNRRYVSDTLLHPNRSSDRREEVSQGQNPFAIIVGCSDSRVAPEIIFDQGLGDLFIVRVAGNVVGPIELDSIEYSVKYLGSSLILVMGHESCGAVTAVFEGKTKDIEEVANLMTPSMKGATTVEEAVKANVRYTVARLKKSILIQRLIAEGKLDVAGSYYHLGSGIVEILP